MMHTTMKTMKKAAAGCSAAALLSALVLCTASATAGANGAAAAPLPPGEALMPAKPSAELTAFKKAVRQQYDLKEKAWAAGDYKALVTGFYARNAFTAFEGDPEHFSVGRTAFLEMYKTYVQDTTKVRIESVHTHVNGNMGWDWTNFYADVKPEKVKDYPPSPVRILFLWERIDGKWMCTGDVVLLGKFAPPVAGR